MSFLFCYASLVLISNVKIEARKVLILDNNANGIIVLKKHVYVNHCMIANIFEKRKTNILK
jgi:phage regulator Rha-like protein